MSHLDPDPLTPEEHERARAYVLGFGPYAEGFRDGFDSGIRVSHLERWGRLLGLVVAGLSGGLTGFLGGAALMWLATR